MPPAGFSRARRVCTRCVGALALGGFPLVSTGLRGVSYHEWANQVALAFRLGVYPMAAICQGIIILGLADENTVVIYLLPASRVCVALFTLRASVLTRWLT